MILKISNNTEHSIVLHRGFTDFIKFIAAIMVAYGHYAGYALDHTSNPLYRISVMFLGSLGVALFFFISGYGLMMSERRSHLDLWPFIKRRLSKVYLPVVLVSFIWQLVLWPYGAGWDRIPDLLYSTFWGFSDGILWFVKAIMICYGLFRLYLLFRKSVFGTVCALTVGTIVAYTLVYHLFADWAAISIPLFSLGILIADYNEKSYKILRSRNGIIIISLITALMVLLFLYKGNLYLKSLFNWYVIFALLLFASRLHINVDIPKWWGEISYDIYITHNKVINYLKPMYTYIGFWRFTLVVSLVASLVHLLRKLLKI